MLVSLLLIPIVGIFLISITSHNNIKQSYFEKSIALITSIVNLLISLVIFLLYSFYFATY